MKQHLTYQQLNHRNKRQKNIEEGYVFNGNLYEHCKKKTPKNIQE